MFAGADYGAILEAAEAETDLILWDGGNNDTPFIRPDLDICVVDPHRAGHELRYWPGEANLRRAGVIVINKVDSAALDDLATIRSNVEAANPGAMVIEAASVVRVDDPDLIAGKRVLVVEDGPTTTHGEMAYGAGMVAARTFGASEVIDPRPFAVGSLVDVFEKWTHLEQVLPAMGYGEDQRNDLRETIQRASAQADVVIVGTPIDLAGLLDLETPSVRVYYDLEEKSGPSLEELVARVLRDHPEM